MNRVGVILHKEWLELRQQRGLLVSALAMPVIFVLLPLVVILGTSMAPESAGKTNVPQSAFANPALAGLSEPELVQALVGQQMSLLLVLLPIILPSIIASYSIVGEKTSRTLEPLLVTPIKTWELLVGKGLAALLPSVGLTWLAAAIFSGEIAAVARTPPPAERLPIGLPVQDCLSDGKVGVRALIGG